MTVGPKAIIYLVDQQKNDYGTMYTNVESCLCYLAIARSLILDSNIGDVVSETSRASSCSSASLTACTALQILATYVNYPVQNRRNCEQQL